MKLNKTYVNWIVFAAVVLACIGIDQATKFGFEGMEKSLLGNFLWISSVHNQGAAFSMFEGARWVFVAIGLVAFVAILFVVFAKKVSQDHLFVISLALIGGGIVGNVVDRVAYGFVRDFIDFRFSGFAIFNFADSFLCVGCALLVLWVILASVRDYKKKKAEKQSGSSQSEGNK